MLGIDGLTAGYGPAPVLRDIALEAEPGRITAIMGRNGAGKTTLMKSVIGLVRASAGRIVLDGTDLAALPANRVPGQGVGYVPQGRRLFGELSVAQNLKIGLMAGPAKGRAAAREDALRLFPRLRERLSQRAGTLSGGEQQMLATARALCLRPRLLLLDEPTEGLQPSMIAAIREVMEKMRDQGLIVLLVEQRVDAVTALADRVFVMENGRMVDRIDRADLPGAEARLMSRLGI
ncbi:ABC transporter ATP-binding protein [Pseudooceanicola aestuarii]|uniref:ABC transporter ATP-binding protein n=1 Tax=Pseudooceanicola aestuarii TaxID=2697319 RepID=UPI0013D85AD6|nr:ABC transporter ATP-binding protein [Pseudooceanicola aestuarii]